MEQPNEPRIPVISFQTRFPGLQVSTPNTHKQTDLGHNRWHKVGLLYSKDLILQDLTSHPGTSHVPVPSAKQKSSPSQSLLCHRPRPTHKSAFIQVVGELNGNWKNEWLSHLSPAAGHKNCLNSGVSALQNQVVLPFTQVL